MDTNIHLDLNADEAVALHDILRDTLPDLKREVARTEHHVFRHELIQRQELCERLIAKLESDANPSAVGRSGID